MSQAITPQDAIANGAAPSSALDQGGKEAAGILNAANTPPVTPTGSHNTGTVDSGAAKKAATGTTPSTDSTPSDASATTPNTDPKKSPTTPSSPTTGSTSPNSPSTGSNGSKGSGTGGTGSDTGTGTGSETGDTGQGDGAGGQGSGSEHTPITFLPSPTSAPTSTSSTSAPLQTSTGLPLPNMTSSSTFAPSSTSTSMTQMPNMTATSSIPSLSTSYATVSSTSDGNVVLVTQTSVATAGALPPTGGGSEINLGAIIGGIAGGIAGLILLTYLILLPVRRRARKQREVEWLAFEADHKPTDNSAEALFGRPATNAGLSADEDLSQVEMKNLGSDDNVVQYGHSDAHGSDAYGPNLAGQGLSHMRSMDSHMYPHNGARSVPGWSAHGDEQVAPDPQQYGYDPTYGGYDAYGGYYDAGQQPPPASYDAHGPGYEVMMPPSQEYGGNSLSAHSSPATGPVHVTGPGGLGYSTSVNARSGAGGHSLSNSISMRSMSNQPHAQAYSNDMPMMEHSNSSAAHLARQASAGTAYSYPSDHQHNARPPMPQRSGTTLNVVQPAGGHYGPHHGGELSRTGTPDDTALEPPRGPLHVVNNGE